MSQGGFVSNFERKNLAAVFFSHLARTLGIFCGILNQTLIANSHTAFGQLFWFSGKCVCVQKVLTLIMKTHAGRGQFLCIWPSRSLSLCLTLSIPLFLSLPISLLHTPTLSPLSLTLSLTHALSLTHTNTHTHTPTDRHTHTHRGTMGT